MVIPENIKSNLMLALILVGVLALAGCGKKEENKSTADQEQSSIFTPETMDLREPNAEQRDLIRYYIEMRQRGLIGQVEQFVQMRDSLTNAIVKDYLGWRQVPMDSVKVSNWAHNWPDISGLPIAQDAVSGEWRRILFREDWVIGDRGLEKTILPMVIFRKNGDQWKVSNATRYRTYKYNKNGSPFRIDQISYHPLFRLPPDFDDLTKRDTTSGGPKPIEIDPEDLKDTIRSIN